VLFSFVPASKSALLGLKNISV